jgi:hypothetical protein
VTKEVKSCFYWREHPSVLAKEFRTLSAQVSAGRKAGANSHIVLPGSSKDDNAKKMMRKARHED